MNCLIFGGSFFFPVASLALEHYCLGDGNRLVVNSDYIKNSPVVKKHLANMKVGEIRKVGLHQWEDWRLSFAINPFRIEKRNDKVIIRQWMQFDRTNKVITWLFVLPIPDNIVHVYDCRPYEFYSEWEI